MTPPGPPRPDDLPTDPVVEQLLSDHPEVAGDALGDLLEWMALRLTEAPDEVTARRHLAAISAAQRAERPHTGRRIGGAVAASVAASALLLGSAGMLPPPVQRLAADTVARVGIDWPTEHSPHSSGITPPEPGRAPIAPADTDTDADTDSAPGTDPQTGSGPSNHERPQPAEPVDPAEPWTDRGELPRGNTPAPVPPPTPVPPPAPVPTPGPRPNDGHGPAQRPDATSPQPERREPPDKTDERDRPARATQGIGPNTESDVRAPVPTPPPAPSSDR